MIKPVYTEEEIARFKAEIDAMSHEDMCRLWRFASAGHIYFNSTLPFVEHYKERLFKYFGGFTPEISKRIGWWDK